MTVKTDVIESINPADESVIEEIPVTQTKRVEELINEAKSAQAEWSQRPLEERVELLERASSELSDRHHEIAKNLTTEQGKPLTESLAEVKSSIHRIEYFCKLASECLDESIVPVNNSVTGRIRREPYGLVAAIKPWNFPVNLPLWTIVPALLAGNTVLFKPSELTPIIGRKLIECFPDELSENNILNLVQGGGELGRTIVDHEAVDFVSFIGSRQTGQWIYKNSSEHLRGLSLELGGKDPMLILEDADPDRASSDLLHGAFKNCGQVCCGVERCLIHADLYDEVLERLKEGIDQLVVGDGLESETDVGPMIRQTERERVKEQLRDAETKGADIFYASDLPHSEHGFWQPPAIVTNVDENMTIMNQETFGPVVAIQTFEKEEEAVGEANRLEYGLGASVYSEDPARAKRVAERIEAGSIGINQTVGSIVELPWGGVKQSGLGRMLGEEGILEFTQSVVERWNPEEFDTANFDY